MNTTQFEQHALEDPDLHAFLNEVSKEAATQISPHKQEQFITVTGVDLLFTLGAYALYRWANDYFNHRRALQEIEILDQQTRVVAALIKDGFPPEQAQAAAAALLSNIAKRTEDDPALKKVLALVGR